MNWFTCKIYPQFWQDYVSHFKDRQEHDLNKVRFVVFDTETTGLDTKTDCILSIGCVAINDLKVKVSDYLEYYLKQEQFNSDTVKIHGLLKEGKLTKLEEKVAIIKFLDYVKNAVLVAHHAAFDIAMINASLKRMGLPRLKNKVLDTGHLFQKTKLDTSKLHYSLDELSERFKIPLHDRHTASGDAYITALLFLKIVSKLNQSQGLKLKDLLRPVNRRGLL
ncbi:3'-5' exonuclease [Winogradskyella sp.]|uniref:3'-5' exonuclease n=1 Tax=Winogradskyella sp. TaxID=1883156 RepID=UPI003F6CB1D5